MAALPAVQDIGTNDRRQAGPLNTVELAAQFAVAIGDQWRREVVKRRLDDLYPLDVRWVGVTVPWTAEWDWLERMAHEGAGRPPTRRARWAACVQGLAGGGRELPQVIGRVPTGRLLVLGAPGAGKTMLVVRLVLDLLERRADGDPVPVLASLASWDPARQDLQQWLADVVASDHPALALPAPPGHAETSQAGVLLAAGMVMPVLDELDEIPPISGTWRFSTSTLGPLIRSLW